MKGLNGWMNTTEASRLTGYSQAYVRILARRGQVRARKMGRDWLIDRSSLLAHKRRMDKLGPEKHSPWREDLVEEGRGREHA